MNIISCPHCGVILDMMVLETEQIDGVYSSKDNYAICPVCKKRFCVSYNDKYITTD